MAWRPEAPPTGMRTPAPGRVMAAIAVVAAGLCAGAAGSSTTAWRPTAVAFVDRDHGVVARVDPGCPNTRCASQLLVTTTGGTTWKVVLRALAPVSLTAVRGTKTIWAATSTSVLRSSDAGLTWRLIRARPVSALSFATPQIGWVIPAGSTVGRPAPILSTADGGRSWTRVATPCRHEWAIPVALARPTPSTGWIVCVSQASTGVQGKEVWSTPDAGRSWHIAARTRFPGGMPGAAGLPNRGDLPAFGYPTGVDALPDGRVWLWESRGWLLETTDGAHWRHDPATAADTVAATSASLVDDRLGYALLLDAHGTRLVRTTDSGGHWTTVRRFPAG